MEIDILDEILNYLLFVQKADKPYVVGNQEQDRYFIKYEKQFFRSAINKLIKDEKVILLSNVRIDIVNQTSMAGLIDITFDGIVFIQNGGYRQAMLENQKKQNAYADLQSEQRRQSASLVRLNRWIVFGAIVVAIDSILNILKFFGVAYCV